MYLISQLHIPWFNMRLLIPLDNFALPIYKDPNIADHILLVYFLQKAAT